MAWDRRRAYDPRPRVFCSGVIDQKSPRCRPVPTTFIVALPIDWEHDLSRSLPITFVQYICTSDLLLCCASSLRPMRMFINHSVASSSSCHPYSPPSVPSSILPHLILPSPPWNVARGPCHNHIALRTTRSSRGNIPGGGVPRPNERCFTHHIRTLCMMVTQPKKYDTYDRSYELYL